MWKEQFSALWGWLAESTEPSHELESQEFQPLRDCLASDDRKMKKTEGDCPLQVNLL